MRYNPVASRLVSYSTALAKTRVHLRKYIDGLVQDCSISCALALSHMNIPELCTWLSVCHPVKKNHLSDIQEKGNRKWDEKHKLGIASWGSLYWFFTAPQSMYKLPQSGSVQLYRSCFVDRPVFGWDVTSATTKFVLLSIYLFIYICILFHFWGRSSSVHFSVSRTTWGSALSVLYNSTLSNAKCTVSLPILWTAALCI